MAGGNTCGKELKCTHTCTLMCHPGPCMTCESQTRFLDCLCKKTKVEVKCQQLLESDFKPRCEQVNLLNQDLQSSFEL
jgi:hypothetical protein